MFNGTRLSVARKRASLTKKELSRRVGVEPRAVTGFEAGEYQPAEETQRRLAEALGYPLQFFLEDDLDQPGPGGVSFRSMSKMTARQRDAAIAAGSLAFVLADWVDREFDLPIADIPDMREDEPTVAAAGLRHLWGLGSRPIQNMVHLLELKGVRVFSLSEPSKEVDAYSLWRADRPFVFLNNQKSSERSRFDAAHELGHLVLHKHAAPSGIDAEKESNAFAAEFLMPEASLRTKRVHSLSQVLEMKAYWGVSTSAMVYRLYAIGMISKWTYQQFFIEISRRGWRLTEPDERRRELSQVWKKVFEALRREGRGLPNLASDLNIPAEELTKLVFGLVTVEVPGNPAPSLIPSARRGHLRLVK